MEKLTKVLYYALEVPRMTEILVQEEVARKMIAACLPTIVGVEEWMKNPSLYLKAVGVEEMPRGPVTCGDFLTNAAVSGAMLASCPGINIDVIEPSPGFATDFVRAVCTLMEEWKDDGGRYQMLTDRLDQCVKIGHGRQVSRLMAFAAYDDAGRGFNTDVLFIREEAWQQVPENARVQMAVDFRTVFVVPAPVPSLPSS
jgi:hypothetical protein